MRPQRPVVNIPDVLFDKQTPRSLEAEMSLLGSMILDSTIIEEVTEVVKSGAEFYSEAHRAIFDALVSMNAQSHAGDLVQLVEVLRSSQTLEAIGGPDYLVQIAESLPSAVNWPYYAGIVSRKHQLRQVVRAAGEILHDVYHAGALDDSSTDLDIIKRAEQRMFEATEMAVLGKRKTLAELLAEAEAELTDPTIRTTGLTTEFTALDALTGGWKPGHLVVLAARPSIGKSQMAVQFALNAAIVHKANPAFFSFEMDAESLFKRAVATEAGVPPTNHHAGNPEVQKAVREAVARIQDSGGVDVVTASGMTVSQIQSRVRRLISEKRCGLVIVDYLQLVRGPVAKRENRQTEVSDISRGLKAMSMELKVPVIALSQLNRESERREGNRPKIADLRESGAIEQDADIVILLHREEHHHAGEADWAEQNPEKVGVAEVIVAKQRSGSTGVVELRWDHRNASFTPLWGTTHASPQKAYRPFERDRDDAPAPF